MNYVFGKYRNTLIKLLSSLIGFLFIISAFVKVFNLQTFISSLSNFIPALSGYNKWIGLIVVLFELTLGVKLFLRKNLRITSLFSIILIFLFVILLTYNILLGNNADCNCFGFISSYYSLNVQLIIDIILLNCLLVLFYLTDKNITRHSIEGNRLNWLIAFLFYLFVNVALFQVALSGSSEKNENFNNFLTDVLSTIKLDKLNGNRIKVFFLISFKDFSCPLCYDSFLATSDSLINIKTELDIFYLFEKTSLESNLSQKDRLEEWTKIVGIENPSYIIPDSLFNRYTNKSCIIVFNQNNKVIFYEIFPIDPIKQKNIINYLK